MDVNMDECGITPKSDNTSIYFPLTIQAETDTNAIIYRETPGFTTGFKCYFQREMKFSGGIAGTITTTGTTVNKTTVIQIHDKIEEIEKHNGRERRLNI